MPDADRYFLKSSWQPDWEEVSRESWIETERAAGFYPKCASTDPRYMTICATGGFTSGTVSGRIDKEDGWKKL